MDSILRGALIYLLLLLVFRIGGKRSLAQITTFDFVLLLIIAEAVNPALVGNADSLTNSLLLVLTLLALDVGLSFLKLRSPAVDKLIDGVPLLLVEEGRPLRDRMRKERVDEADIMTAARELQGLERMDQVKYAVLERDGNISIIPRQAG